MSQQEQRIVVLDTETTGLSAAEGHRIIEIAGVELINRRPTGRHYQQYICPERSIDAGAVAIHGITEDFLADKPKFSDIVEALLAFLGNAELVIHNAPFDVSFLNSELKRTSKHREPITHYCQVVDTLALARKKHPGQQNSLDALCKRYKIDNSARNLHGALMDTHLLAQVYLAMTGGQTSLFDSEGDTQIQRTTNSIAAVEIIKNKADFVLRVVKANEEELKAHAAQLEVIKKASGDICLWKGDDPK